MSVLKYESCLLEILCIVGFYAQMHTFGCGPYAGQACHCCVDHHVLKETGLSYLS